MTLAIWTNLKVNIFHTTTGFTYVRSSRWTLDSTPRIPDSTHWIPDSTHWIADSTPRILDSTHWITDSTTWIADSIPWIPESTPWIPDSTPRIRDSTPRIPESIPRIPESTLQIPDSTSWILDSKLIKCRIPAVDSCLFRLSSAAFRHLTSLHSIVTIKIAWDREECSFMFVDLKKKKLSDEKKSPHSWIKHGYIQKKTPLFLALHLPYCSVLIANIHNMFNFFDAFTNKRL